MKTLASILRLAAVMVALVATAWSQANPLAENRRFVRGEASNTQPWFDSFVIPLSFQTAVPLDPIGDNAAKFGGQAPWSTRVAKDLRRHLTPSGSPTLWSLQFENPIASFGNAGGGSTLYHDQEYNFGFYSGRRLEGTQQDAGAFEIIIHAYAKASFTGGATNVAPLQSLAIRVPRKGTAGWDDFVRTGYQTTSPVFYGMTTTIRLVEGDSDTEVWGLAPFFPSPYLLTHRATAASADYYFRVEALGHFLNAGVWTPMVKDDAQTTTRANSLYTLSFDQRMPWQSTFISQPHFEGEPLPPAYEGKSLEELLHVTSPVTKQFGAPLAAHTTLDNSPELRRHPILDQFVADVGSSADVTAWALALANYVSNRIQLTDTISYNENGQVTAAAITDGGVNRGALATFQEEQGSPKEQCALLVYLLRQAGIPAVYANAANNGLTMLDARMSKLLRMQLQGLLDNQGDSDVPHLIPVNYPWVAAYVPDQDNPGQSKWVHIFPWMKDTEIKEGFNLFEYMPAGFKTGTEWTRKYLLRDPTIVGLSTEFDMPSFLFPKFIETKLAENHPGLTLADMGVQIRDRQLHRNRWDEFGQPWSVSEGSGPIAIRENLGPSATASVFDTASVEVYSDSNANGVFDAGEPRIVTGEIPSLYLHNRQMLLRHVKTGTNQHTMSVTLEAYRPGVAGQGSFGTSDPTWLQKQVASVSLTSADDLLRLKVVHTRHRALGTGFQLPPHWNTVLGLTHLKDNTDQKTLRKGDTAAICFNFGRVTQRMVNVHAEEFWKSEQLLEQNPGQSGDAEIFQGKVSYIMGMSYYEKVSRFQEQLRNLCKINVVSAYANGLAKLSPARNPDGTLPNGGDLDLIYPVVDMFFQRVAWAGNGTLRPDSGNTQLLSTRDFFPISIADVSAQEHRVINTYFKQLDAISTVKLLHLAQTGGSPIIELLERDYLAKGEVNYTSNGQTKKLKEWDTGIWKQVADGFALGHGSYVALEDVQWTSLVGTAATYPGGGSRLQKTAAGNAWNTADAVGTKTLADGFVQFKFGQTDKEVMLGLSLGNTDRNFTSLAYAIYGNATGAAGVVENGTVIGTVPGGYTVNDVFRIERKAGNITYSKNGTPFYISAKSTLQALYIDTSFFTSGAAVTNCQIGIPGWDRNYQQVFMTPGPVAGANGTYRGMGALLIAPGSYAALISENLSGGWGRPAPSQSFAPINFSNISLNIGHDYTPNISFSQPTFSNPILTPSSVSLFNLTQTTNYISSGASVLSTFQNASFFEANNTLNLGGVSNAQIFNQTSNLGYMGSTNWLQTAVEFVSDPVNVLTGDFYVDAVDLRLNGPMPLEIRRNYQSSNKSNNQFGYGWKMAYTPYLSVASGDALIYAAEMDGSVIAYRRQANPNLWIPTSADNPRLHNVSSDAFGSLGNALNGKIEKAGNIYTLTGADGSVRTCEVRSYAVDANNQRTRPYLTRWRDNRGNYHDFIYGNVSTEPEWGQLVRIQSKNGNFAGFYYDVYGRIIEAYTGDGRRLFYRYDEHGDLIEVTLPDGSVIGYDYQHNSQVVNGQPQFFSDHLIIREKKPEGRVLENDYDTERRVKEQRATVGENNALVRNAKFDYFRSSAVGQPVTGYTLVTSYRSTTTPAVTRYDYADGMVTAITDPLNQTISQEWYLPGDASPGAYPRSLKRRTDKRGLVTEFKYDARGNVQEQKTLGDVTGDGVSDTATTNFVHNTLNMLSEITDAVGNRTVLLYENAAYPYALTTTEKYAPGGGLIGRARNEFYNVTSGSLGGFGLLQRETRGFGSADEAQTTHTHNANGFITSQTRATGTGDPNVTVNLRYNLRGELNERRDAIGRKSVFAYDDLGNRIWQERRNEGGTLVGWQYDYFNRNGQIEWSDGPRYDPEDFTWRKYDGAGRPKEELRWRSKAKADGTGVQAQAGDDLFSSALFKHDLFGNLTEISDPRHNGIKMTYDAIGQMKTREVYEGSVATGTLKASESFDYETGGELSVHTSPINGVTRKFYTKAGQLRRQENADGSVLEWRYQLDGRVVREVLRDGSYWETAYDDLNRTTTRTLKTAGGATLAVTSKTMDRRGNVISETDAEGHTWTMTYDDLDRVKTRIGPPATATSARQSSTFTYDNSGKVTIETNALNEQTVTTTDALGRVTLVEWKDAGGTVVRSRSTSYSLDHHSTTVTEGSGAGAIATTSWTDTFGKPVISSSAGEKRISAYDALGNLVSAKDERSQETRYTYDALNRALTEILPDGATTTFIRDAAGNLKERQMPGGLTAKAEYDTAGRKQYEELRNGGSVTRRSDFEYYPAGNAWVGLPKKETDARGVQHVTTYDDFLRAAMVTSTGTLPEHALTRSNLYDKRGLLKQVTQSYGNPAIGPPSVVTRSFDGYGQIYNEAVGVNAAGVSDFTQLWDGAGRRSGLNDGAGHALSYAHNAAGLMTGTGDWAGNSYSFPRGNNGLLLSRSSPWRTQTINLRDGRGRIKTQTTTVGGATPLVETLNWRSDSKIDDYTATRTGGAFNESRDYNYNSRGQLTSESYAPSSGQTATLTYGFDANKLGIRASAKVGVGAPNLWDVHATTVTPLARTTVEASTAEPRVFTATGNALGAGLVNVTLDGVPVAPVSFGGWQGNGDWSVPLRLSLGAHTLTATAHHPSGQFHPSTTNSFTVSPVERTVSSGFDGNGNVETRVITGSSGARTQTLTWDAANRLVKVAERDGANDGYDWTAVYDGLGRRLQTKRVKVTAGVAETSALQIDSAYDPQVEFLEIATRINGARTWKIYGPDLNGSFGGLQGIGGLEATIRDNGNVATGIVSDIFGNAVATVASGPTLTWNAGRTGSYGAFPHLSAASLSETVSVAEATAWRGKAADSTGFYYLGARYYEPIGGRFLSADPAGHSASFSLYDYANGDPINFADPDGRIGKMVFGAASAVLSNNYVQGGLKTVGGVAEAAVGITFGAATSWTGIGAVGGGLVAAHGVDTAISGIRQLSSGRAVDSFTSQGLQAVGVSQPVANIIDGGISIAGTGGLSFASAARTTTVVPNTVSRVETGAESALQYQQLKASLTLQERLGSGKFVTNTTLDVGQTRVAVFDQASGKIFMGRQGSAMHIDVVSEHGLNVGDDLIGGFIKVGDNGQIQFAPISGSFPLPTGGNAATILDQIRGTGVSILGGM